MSINTTILNTLPGVITDPNIPSFSQSWRVKSSEAAGSEEIGLNYGKGPRSLTSTQNLDSFQLYSDRVYVTTSQKEGGGFENNVVFRSSDNTNYVHTETVDSQNQISDKYTKLVPGKLFSVPGDNSASTKEEFDAKMKENNIQLSELRHEADGSLTIDQTTIDQVENADDAAVPIPKPLIKTDLVATPS